MADLKPTIPAPGSQVHDFRLGDRVKDKLNGIEGRAVARQFHMTGCDRFTLELDLIDGKPGELYAVASERIGLLVSHPELHREEVPDMHVHLGDKVTAKHLGFSGVVTVINVPIHGSPQCCIEPQWDSKTKKMPEAYFVDVAFITVDEPYTPRPKEATKPKPAAKQEPGCSRLGRGMLSR